MENNAVTVSKKRTRYYCSICIVPGCTNGLYKKENVHFHRLPLRDDKLLESWVISIKRPDPPLNASARVCSEHFTDEDYVHKMKFDESGRLVQYKTTVLQKGAVPTKFDSCATGSGSVINRKRRPSTSTVSKRQARFANMANRVTSAAEQQSYVMQTWSLEHPTPSAAIKDEVEPVGLMDAVRKTEPGSPADVAVPDDIQGGSIAGADYERLAAYLDAQPARHFGDPIVIVPVKTENAPGFLDGMPEEIEPSLPADLSATEIKIEIESAKDEDPGILQNADHALTSKAVHQKEEEWTVRDILGPVKHGADDTGDQHAAVSEAELKSLDTNAPSASQCVQIYVPIVHTMPESTLNKEKQQCPELKRQRKKRKRNICQIVYRTELKTPRKRINICQIVSTTRERKYNLRKRSCCDYLKLNESGEKAYKCRTCSKSLPTQTALKSHILDHARKNRYKCAVCKKQFVFFRNLKYHEFSHRRGKVYQCSVCKNSADMRIGLKSYMRLHSACLKICMSARNPSKKKHMVTHTDKKQEQCDVCLRYFSGSHALRAHKRIHSRTKPFKCSVCEKSFQSRTTQKNHISAHTNPKFQCSICGKLLRNSGSLKQHMFTHTGEKPFLCSQCPSSFTHQWKLKFHMRTHTGEKPFPCSQCPASFSHQWKLKIHIRIHTGETPFQCTLCPQRFTCSARRRQHMANHTGVRPFSCQVCAKSFLKKYYLKRHMCAHTGEKPFQCSQCSSSFSQHGNLKIHMLTHTGEKPHLCSVCGRGTTTKQSLEQHMRTHSKEVHMDFHSEKTFKCSVCAKCLTSAGRLINHMRRHGDEKP